MALDTELFATVEVATKAWGNHKYGVTADDVTAVGYFNELFDDLRLNDVIAVHTGTSIVNYIVTGLTSDGVVTVTAAV